MARLICLFVLLNIISFIEGKGEYVFVKFESLVKPFHADKMKYNRHYIVI